MAWSNFRLQIARRVLLLTASLIVAVWGWVIAPWLVTPIVAAVLAALIAGELIWFVEREQRELSTFISSISHHDYSVPVPERSRGRSFDRLDQVYRALSAEFKRLNLQKAANHEYLEAVVEHVGVALISIDEAGQLVMMNRRARELFGMQLGSIRSFARFDAGLPGLLDRLGDGERDLLTMQHADDRLQIVVYATTFTLLDARYKLVSFQNIRDELERREIESWQRLIRVLTHEIMNSVTPIISISKLAEDTLAASQAEGATMTSEERDDLLRGLGAVHSRSNGLLEFVKAYRSFAAVPAPLLRRMSVATLVRRAQTLMSASLAEQGVVLAVECSDEALHINADAQQLEQALINLIRNAGEALAGTNSPRIVLSAARDERGRVAIQVRDNGPGIDAEHVDNIFVPFFTTKRGGTGVGLSISRQLVQANRGFIALRPEPQGAAFLLRFPAADG
jgi:nitrogen fixation/metabolism regulation signal transduction histidine kinase